MKKLLIAALAAFICMPAFAQPDRAHRVGAKNIKAPVQAGCHGRKAFTGAHHRRGLAQAEAWHKPIAGRRRISDRRAKSTAPI